MKTILGTGQSGMAVMEALLKINPHDLITLVNRSGKLKANLPQNITLVSADVTDNVSMEKIARASDVIFSCTDVSYELWSSFYPATANALAYAVKNSNTKLVVADNLYSYGNVSGALMIENLPHLALTRKGRIRAQVLETLLHDEFGKRVAFVKAADFIGPGVHKGIFGTDFIERLYYGSTIMLAGKVMLPHSFTYIHDFARALVNVGSADDTFGQVWHAPNATAMGLDKWIHLFEVNSGRKAKVIVLPKAVVRFAGLFNALVREFHELAYQFEFPYRVDSTKYIERFGDHSTSPSMVVKQTVQWYKSENHF